MVSLEELESLSAEEKAELLKLLELKKEQEKYKGHFKYFPDDGPHARKYYQKHLQFFKAGSQHSERVFMAANRSGKTVAGAYEMSCHLTGLYPDWWEGKVFNSHGDYWAAGDTGQTTRDIVQAELIGQNGFGTGMIPYRCLDPKRKKMRPGYPDALDVVEVQHTSGGWSRLGFKSYDQKRRSFQGTAKNAIWLDEECPLDVYDECNMRIMTTNGIIYVTFTPLQGLTQFIQNFQRAAAEKTYE